MAGGKGLSGEAQAVLVGVEHLHRETVGLKPQPLVENILKAEQQEPVQGAWQVQLGQDWKQTALQEGSECTASQVLQGARSLLQREK